MKEELDEEKVAKAFSAGYWMQKHEPELLQKITTAENKQNEYVTYMEMGAQQAEREKIKDYQQSIKDKQHEKKRGR